MYWSTFVLLFGASITATCLGEECIAIEGYNSCACKFNETKTVVNLAPLAPKNATERPRYELKSLFWFLTSCCTIHRCIPGQVSIESACIYVLEACLL
jgi:hypothetical protein